RSMGALVGGGGLPFIASVRYLAGPSPDSTLALFSVSLTNQTLTFQRRGVEFIAEYHVEASFRADSTSRVPVRQIGSDEQVRLPRPCWHGSWMQPITSCGATPFACTGIPASRRPP